MKKIMACWVDYENIDDGGMRYAKIEYADTSSREEAVKNLMELMKMKLISDYAIVDVHT